MRVVGLLHVLTAVILLGCGSSREVVRTSVFSFDCDGTAYQIISRVEPDGGGSNFLIRREGDVIVLRAVDRERNASIDTVSLGSISLQEANRIYSEGLARAMSTGRFAVQEPPRLFTLELGGRRFLVQTWRGDSATYNRFTIVELDGTEHAFVDHGATGRLDDGPEDYDFDRAQELYEMTVRRGVQAGQIHRAHERLIVRAR